MDPAKVHDKMVEKGREKARTAAYAQTTDRLRKQVRAKLMVEFINQGSPIGKAEQLALTHEDYIEASENAEKAEEEAGIAAVEYEAAKAWLSIWQTTEATRRAEMTLR